jgi:hypothetical protein
MHRCGYQREEHVEKTGDLYITKDMGWVKEQSPSADKLENTPRLISFGKGAPQHQTHKLKA